MSAMQRVGRYGRIPFEGWCICLVAFGIWTNRQNDLVPIQVQPAGGRIRINRELREDLDVGIGQTGTSRGIPLHESKLNNVSEHGKEEMTSSSTDMHDDLQSDHTEYRDLDYRIYALHYWVKVMS